MVPTDEAALRLARELIYFAGHGYSKANQARYPILMAVPQVAGRLPISATDRETVNYLDSVLIEAIGRFPNSIVLRYTGAEILPSDLRDHWTRLLGLPPYHRAKQLERHRGEVADALGAGSIPTFRRVGGPEEELFTHLASWLLDPPSGPPSGRWIVRKSMLHYFIAADHSIERIVCLYDAETVADGVMGYGVDHRSTADGKVAEYDLVEDSVIGCDRLERQRLTDKSLSLDLYFDSPLPRGTRRLLGYTLDVRIRPDRFQVLRLNAAVIVWEHELTVTFDPAAAPSRVWWFTHHVGTGVGSVPEDSSRDLSLVDLSVQQSFAGLRQGPDYGIAFHWEKGDTVGDSVTSLN